MLRRPWQNIRYHAGKLYGFITMHCLRILHSASTHSQMHQPEKHKQYAHPGFPTAIARLFNRYTNKASDGSKKSKLANQYTIPDRYMQAIRDDVSMTNRRFASPLNFSPHTTCHFSMYAEDTLFGADVGYSVKWTKPSQVNLDMRLCHGKDLETGNLQCR